MVWSTAAATLGGPWSGGGAGRLDVLGMGRTTTSFDASMAEREGDAIGCMDADVAILNGEGAADVENTLLFEREGQIKRN